MNGVHYFCSSEFSSVVLVHISVALDSTQHGLRRGIVCVLGDGVQRRVRLAKLPHRKIPVGLLGSSKERDADNNERTFSSKSSTSLSASRHDGPASTSSSFVPAREMEAARRA